MTVYVSVSPTVIVEVLSSSALLVKALLRVGFAFAAKVIVLEASKARRYLCRLNRRGVLKGASIFFRLGNRVGAF